MLTTWNLFGKINFADAQKNHRGHSPAAASIYIERTLIIEQWNNPERLLKNIFIIFRKRTFVQEWTRPDSVPYIIRKHSNRWIRSTRDRAVRRDSETNHNMRVWSWLRMNAGGVLNTCKSNEAPLPQNGPACWERKQLGRLSGGRVSNAWATCPIEGDNSRKRLLIPHSKAGPHGPVLKDLSLWDGPASD